MRYKIELSYNGKNFYGWQRQQNSTTVQQTIEDAFELIFKEKIEIVGCGRTDTGVHAKYYVAHFDSNFKYDHSCIYKLNRFLKNDISIFSISEINNNFHARFSAKNRTYEYYINIEKNPFNTEFSYYIPQKLNIKLMKDAMLKLFNYKDFTSFSKLHTDVKTNNCEIKKAEIIEKNNDIIIRITSDRFLRNMVRAIVGTLIEVGKGKKTVEDFCKIIESKNRNFAGQSVPPHALFLVDIEY